MIVVVLLAVTLSSLVTADRHRRRMRELQPEEQQESLDQIVARTSWMRWGN
ncbi:MAG: hypothetical protein JO246_16270 [Frankiaceae bacterium]|nr:hypothetical protein [Frankiaceae bacterium]